ncbi:MAG: SsrA-binding protein SmpB [Verrucomicrobia bacterium]|nr:SsrA-binding protein SmpB [Verrucomicrobiota bacterium]MBU6446424.1 SsrA-binding protein SmpB [Verrucomicrobiota bacterium]MDE3047833.1 SsrA-binding protein SmpB [Verrucomicrobiota bacterium]
MEELVTNRKASHDYEILETFEAGLILLGSEIKSLRNHGGSLQDAYVDVRGGDITLLNASIAPYSKGGTSIFNHEERRPRKLLMHKREIEMLRKKVHEKGLTVIPLAIYLNKKGIAKVRIALAKGKKSHDKRAALKEKADRRSMRDLDS